MDSYEGLLSGNNISGTVTPASFQYGDNDTVNNCTSFANGSRFQNCSNGIGTDFPTVEELHPLSNIVAAVVIIISVFLSLVTVIGNVLVIAAIR